MRTPPALGTDQPSTIPPAWSDPPSDLWTRSWHATAPRQVVEAYQEGDLPRGWSLWAAHLRHRKRPAEAGQLWSDKTSPLLWAVAALPADSNTVRLLQQLHPLVRGKQRAGPEAVEWIAAWLDEATQPGRDVADDLECVAWSYALVPLARHAAPQLWWELLAHLLAAARQGEDEDIERDPVRYSLLAGELALSLAWQFPELKPCRRLGKTARRALSALVVELLDGEGMPHARQLGELPLLTATWTRCRAIGSQLKENCWNAKAERQYEWLVTQNLRLADPHGAWLLA
ncbi:MAG: hypothetical protein GTO03_10495, partial [Planctomycetales bacterium]|nr:hypothetical protein [Planctomycetales bacterium]